jgi:hypothetical protein
MAYEGGRPNGRTSRYTEEDAQTVEQAKRVHKETTASAQRALKVQMQRSKLPTKYTRHDLTPACLRVQSFKLLPLA